MKLFRSQTVSTRRFFSEAILRKNNEFHQVLTIVTWPPSIRKLDNQGEVVERIPLLSVQEKLSAISSRTEETTNVEVEVYGHAAAELFINLKSKQVSPILLKTIQQEAKLTDVVFNKIESLCAYVSWFPESRYNESGEREFATTGRRLTYSDIRRMSLPPKPLDMMPIKEGAADFLTQEFEAKTGSLRSDTRNYGPPNENRIISLTELDYVKIIRALFDMMAYTLTSENVLVMNKVLSHAKFFGSDILREHRSRTHIYANLFIPPEHVCTTAVLKLLKSGIGLNKYNEVYDKVMADDSRLSHGYPLVDLTHALAQELHRLESVQLLNIVNNKM